MGERPACRASTRGAAVGGAMGSAMISEARAGRCHTSSSLPADQRHVLGNESLARHGSALPRG